jgi:tetratricopeptide (TPR) repeat protein
MGGEHPDVRLLERFMRNELQGCERRIIVRHLLTGCPDCVAVTRRLWSFGEHPMICVPEARSGPQGDRRLSLDRREASRLLAELLDHPRSRRLALICAEERFQNTALCGLLIERSRRAGTTAEAEEMAEAAVAIAGQIDGRPCGATVARSLRARSWAHLGDARRLGGDLAGAEEALASAEPLYGKEAADPLDVAELHSFKACLLGEQGKLEEAGRLLDRVLALHRSSGERHLQGRTLIQKGTIRSWAVEREGEPAARESIGLLREGLALLDEGADPGLAANGLHRLGLLLAETDRGEEALAAAKQARILYEELEDASNLIRLRRLEGKAEEVLGRLDAAETALLEARQGFLREGLAAETALVVLELAVIYKRQKRSPDLHRLAGEISPIFRTRDIRRHIAAALLVFRRIVETEHANLEFLVEIARFLAGPPRCRRPALRWV